MAIAATQILADMFKRVRAALHACGEIADHLLPMQGE
jgi:hypothetical protein